MSDELNAIPMDDALVSEDVVYGNQDINDLITSFETVMDLKMPRAQFQRRAAKTLLQRYGLDRCRAAISYVAATRDHEYVPQVMSLEDLRDKWNRLEQYGRKHLLMNNEADAIKRMVGGK